jgi:hypothetical protein
MYSYILLWYTLHKSYQGVSLSCSYCNSLASISVASCFYVLVINSSQCQESRKQQFVPHPFKETVMRMPISHEVQCTGEVHAGEVREKKMKPFYFRKGILFLLIGIRY